MLKKIEFNFNVSNRYEFFVDEEGHVFKIDTRNGDIEECYYHIAHGYYRIRVTDIDTGSRKYLRVHRLVAEAFIPNPEGYDIVMHLDNDKSNNSASNLKWGTVSENTQQAYDDGLIKDRGGWKTRRKNQENKK